MCDRDNEELKSEAKKDEPAVENLEVDHTTDEESEGDEEPSATVADIAKAAIDKANTLVDEFLAAENVAGSTAGARTDTVPRLPLTTYRAAAAAVVDAKTACDNTFAPGGVVRMAHLFGIVLKTTEPHPPPGTSKSNARKLLEHVLALHPYVMVVMSEYQMEEVKKALAWTLAHLQLLDSWNHGAPVENDVVLCGSFTALTYYALDKAHVNGTAKNPAAEMAFVFAARVMSLAAFLFKGAVHH